MTATRAADGRWQVVEGSKILAENFATSAEAWRWIDRHTGQPISKSEARAQWHFDNDNPHGGNAA